MGCEWGRRPALDLLRRGPTPRSRSADTATYLKRWRYKGESASGGLRLGGSPQYFQTRTAQSRSPLHHAVSPRDPPGIDRAETSCHGAQRHVSTEIAHRCLTRSVWTRTNRVARIRTRRRPKTHPPSMRNTQNAALSQRGRRSLIYWCATIVSAPLCPTLAILRRKRSGAKTSGMRP
jgi:hypothetical protein